MYACTRVLAPSSYPPTRSWSPNSAGCGGGRAGPTGVGAPWRCSGALLWALGGGSGARLWMGFCNVVDPKKDVLSVLERAVGAS